MATSLNSEMHSQDDLTPDRAKVINKELLLSLITTMMENPETDLMALVPPSYIAQMKNRTQRGPRKSSRLAELNQRTFGALLSAFEEDRAALLVNQWYSASYDRLCKRCLAPKKRAQHPMQNDEDLDPFHAMVTRQMLHLATFCFQYLHQYPPFYKIHKESERLWTGFASFVAGLNEVIVMKVDYRDQANHHIALQYLAEHAPNVPVPKPHGLVRLGSLSVLFMSRIPGQVLSTVWLTLTHRGKTSIQQQLDVAFTRIRGIKRRERPFGTIDGQGVQDRRGFSDPYISKDPIVTSAAFEDWIFASRPCGSKSYLDFLKTLTSGNQLAQNGVFTHGDVRPGNIMVRTDESGYWSVSGIFDWEDAGYYLVYWEAIKATSLLFLREENDWYLYLPQSIASSSFAKEWLVDRAREAVVENLKAWNKKPSTAQGAKQCCSK